MDLTKAEKDYLIKEISLELGAKFDGSHKNLICLLYTSDAADD